MEGENSRQRNQRRAKQILRSEGGVVICHPGLTASGNFWAPYGVHPSKTGMEMFISGIQDGLLAFMRNKSAQVQVDEDTGWRKPQGSGSVAEDRLVKGLVKAK